MKHLGDCELELLEGREGWGTCPDCDPNGRKPIPLGMHRNCQNRIANIKRRRARIEEDIVDDVTDETRSMAEIRRTLDKCFDGCRHMGEHCIRRGSRHLGEDYQAWIEHILEHDCEPE
jgi:hypothetical protein